MGGFLERAAALARALNSPHLVEKVQNCFGVQRIVENGRSGDKLRHSNGLTHRHGSTNGASSKATTGRGGGVVLRDTSVPCRVDSALWYYLFHFGSLLGYEMFYATFFPFLLWNFDAAVCRRVLAVWALALYCGGVAKDVIRWPRPSSPPVVQFDRKYAAEYGMPSTHAMTGASVPFGLLVFTMHRYEYSLPLGLLVCTVWCALLCISRLYLGMHTVLDLLGGLLLAWALMLVLVPVALPVDHLLLNSPWGPPLVVGVVALLCLAYPAPREWTPARGDSCVVLATVAGILAGEGALFQTGWRTPLLHAQERYRLGLPHSWELACVLLRTATGIVASVLTRTAAKAVTYRLLCRCQGRDPRLESTRRLASIELPCKFFTYLLMGLTMALGSPLLFARLGIQRTARPLDL
ncbi:sphingosine-1-phosphate phosphatase 2 [Ixodes scapularis]